jgi:3-phosphoshikimate 1-carboxyvinyltransferase
MENIQTENNMIKKVIISAPKKIEGAVKIPPDKSISHRALFLAALANGPCKITNFLEGLDTWGTINCLKNLGVDIVHNKPKEVIVNGIGLNDLKESEEILNIGTSATTMRFLSGFVINDPILTIIQGVVRTNNRPMDRIVEPLTKMGATILGRKNNQLAPLVIYGNRNNHGIDYYSAISSSEVKTSLILASLKMKQGQTIIRNPLPSRDHTERMLAAMGHKLEIGDGGRVIIVDPLQRPLNPIDYKIAGEMSAAVYWIVLGLVHPNADITIKSVCVNPLRMGLINVLKAMNGNIEVKPLSDPNEIEPIADIRVRSSHLKGITIGKEYYPQMADEFVGFALAASLAEGETLITGAEDLRNKKSNRIQEIIKEYRSLGANVEETEDGMRFIGVKKLNGASCESHGDHRLGNSLINAGLVATGETCVDNVIPVTSTSYPTYWEELTNLCGKEVIKRAFYE